MGLRKLASRLQNSFSLARFAWSFKNCCQSPAATIVAHEMPLVTSFQKPLPSNDNDALTAERVEAFCGDNAPKKFLMVFEKFAPSQKFRTEDFSKTVADAFFLFTFCLGKKFRRRNLDFCKNLFWRQEFLSGKITENHRWHRGRCI